MIKKRILKKWRNEVVDAFLNKRPTKYYQWCVRQIFSKATKQVKEEQASLVVQIVDKFYEFQYRFKSKK